MDELRQVSILNDNDYVRHLFEYYDPTLVPSLKSKSQDYWGFFNGVLNSSLLEYVDPTIYGDYAANRANSFYGNRQPVFEKSRVGTIKKITYPTKGTSEFIYESNDYGNVGGTSVNELKHIQNTFMVQAVPSAPSMTRAFTIQSPQSIIVVIQGSYGSPPPVDNGPSILLRKVNSDGTYTTVIQQYMISVTSTQYPALAVGNYEIIASVDGTGQTATANVTYFSLGDSVKTKITGGVRIKQIIDTDPETGSQYFKNFKYTAELDSTRSSGSLGALVSLIYSIPTGKQDCNCGAGLDRSSSSNNYLGLTQGSHIGYTKVIETDSNKVSYLGQKVSYFTSSQWGTPDNQYYSDEYYFNEVSSTNNTVIAILNGKSGRYLTAYDFYRGMPLKEVFYTASNVKIKEKDISYNYPALLDVSSGNYFEINCKVGYKHPVCTVGNTDGSNTTVFEYRLANYKVICPWVYKTNTVDSVFDSEGLNPITTTTNFYYDNPAHGLLTRTTNLNSKGELITVVNKYPNDKSQITDLSSSAGIALDTMVAIHKIGPVIQVDQYKNQTLLSTTRTDYKVWDTQQKIVKPESVNYQTTGGNMERRLSFYRYDAASNILEMSKTNDMHTTYVWSSKTASPTAEVKNANLADVAYTSFEIDGDGNWTIASSVRDATRGITGSSSYALTNGAISKSSLNTTKSYIVSYWSKSGTATVNGSTATSTLSKMGWNYYEHKIPAGTSAINISGSVTIDELRLYPSDALMTTYTYSPLIGVAGQCDAVNHIVYYEYDGIGRLKTVRDLDNNIIKTFEYHYKN